MSTPTRATGEGQTARNRRVACILLSIMGALAAAALLAGIRW
ncbi:MAG TPA: hypothetical protein VLG10_06235 [Methylomirabilota bacterium]|nr:hypothetical protein [Methylomirabilota bacterium]